MSRRPRVRRVVRRGGRSVVVLAVLAVVSGAACGARWTDEERQAVLDRAGTAGGASAAAGPAASGAWSGAGTSPAAGSPTATSGAGPGGARVGSDGGSGAGSGPAIPTGAAADGGPLPCARPSDAPGVTDEEITIGSISSLSGPVPGLGASSAAAVRAHVAYRNANGGVCGRRLVLRDADDGTDNGRYRSLVGDLAPGVLGIAGGFALGDVGGVDIVEANGLPVVNVPSGASVSAVPTVFDINPAYERLDVAIGKYRYLHEQGARRVSLTYLAVDQSRAEATIQRQLMEAAGLEIVQVQELPISTLSFDSPARGVVNSGADYLFFIGDAHANVAMARAMFDTGHRLGVAEYFTFAYGTDFIDAAGAGSEGATTWLRTLPNEEADGNAEMAAFLDWMDETASDGVRDVFAADSWAGAKAFVDALEALPGPISREALVTQLAATGTYDAGGMLGPIRLGAKLSNACVIGMRVESGEWRRMAPADGFLC